QPAPAVVPAGDLEALPAQVEGDPLAHMGIAVDDQDPIQRTTSPLPAAGREVCRHSTPTVCQEGDNPRRAPNCPSPSAGAAAGPAPPGRPRRRSGGPAG